MTWTPEPPLPSRQRSAAWFPDVPDLPPRQLEAAWFPMWMLKVIDTGIGTDQLAAILARLAVTDIGVGADISTLQAVAAMAIDAGIGHDVAGVIPALAITDDGVGTDDQAIVGLRDLRDTGIGADWSTAEMQALLGADTGVGEDTLRLVDVGEITVYSRGVGRENGTGRFRSMGVSSDTYSSSGSYTYTIPVWCDTIDVVAIGGGGGGHGAGWLLSGEGGRAGIWDANTIYRGSTTPWTTRTFSLTVGAGGAGGSGGASAQAGSNGGNSTSTFSVHGTGGARGGGAIIGADQNGQRAGNFSWRNIGYAGGGESQAPGGGGRGGSAASGNGAAGGTGRIWVRAYQS